VSWSGAITKRRAAVIFFLFFFLGVFLNHQEGMTQKKTVVGQSKVKLLLARKKRELVDGDVDMEKDLAHASALLSVASSKIQKPMTVVIPQRRSSPTDWRRENSPQRLWEDLETFM
jgi:hypothetical protein